MWCGFICIVIHFSSAPKYVSMPNNSEKKNCSKFLTGLLNFPQKVWKGRSKNEKRKDSEDTDF